jgi:hypothetical protein
VIEGDLQTQADAENRHAAGYDFPEGLIHTAAGEAPHGRPSSPDSRENDPLGPADPVRIGADFGLETDFRARALNAAQIACVIIYDDGGGSRHRIGSAGMLT